MKKNYARKTARKPDRKGRMVARDNDPEDLPQLTDQLATGFTLRFVTNSNFGGAASITYQNLLDAWLIAGSSTTAYQLFDFVKVRRVTIRAPVASNGNSVTAGIEFPGLNSGQLGSGKQRQNTSMIPNVPAYVSLTPGRDSQAAQYQPSGSSSCFIFRANDVGGAGVNGVIIDVEVSYKNNGAVNPAAIGVARTGMTSGSLYFGGIDGQTLASTIARSCFYPTI